jgi:hypothetical protein
MRIASAFWSYYTASDSMLHDSVLMTLSIARLSYKPLLLLNPSAGSISVGIL